MFSAQGTSAGAAGPRCRSARGGASQMRGTSPPIRQQPAGLVPSALAAARPIMAVDEAEHAVLHSAGRRGAPVLRLSSASQRTRHSRGRLHRSAIACRPSIKQGAKHHQRLGGAAPDWMRSRARTPEAGEARRCPRDAIGDSIRHRYHGRPRIEHPWPGAWMWELRGVSAPLHRRRRWETLAPGRRGTV